MDDTTNPTFAGRRERWSPRNPPQNPPQVAADPAPAPARVGTPGLVKFGIIAGLSLLIFFARFQLNIGPYFANPGLIAQLLVLGMLLVNKKLRVDPTRAVLFVLGMLIMFTAWILSPANSSFLSALLLAACYFAFIFVARMPDGNESLERFTMTTFVSLMMLAAIAGICQFLLQFVIHSAWLFDFTAYIPLLFRGGGTYNTVISAGGFFKSNGFFFREPSTCSQYLALAMICEIAMHRRKMRRLSLIRMGTLGLALLMTYSGTGLVTLVIGLMFPLGVKTVVRMGALGLGAALIFQTLGSVMNLGFTAGRVDEFNKPGTSAYARFIAPMEFISDKVDTYSITFLVGHGPGSITRNVEHRAMYENADPTWAKLLFEYGVIGLVLFVALVFYSTFRSRAPAELIAALCFGWFIIWGGVALAPEITALIFILCAVAAVPPVRRKLRQRVVVDIGHLGMPTRTSR
jgi:hypothetical protein